MIQQGVGAENIYGRKTGWFLRQGDSVSFYYYVVQKEPGTVHSHSEIEIGISFAPAKGIVSWLDHDGTSRQMAINGPGIAVNPPHLRHSINWHSVGEHVVFYIDVNFFKKFAGGLSILKTISEPVVFSLQDLSIWHLACSVRTLFQENKGNDPFYVDAVGGQLAAHVIWILHGMGDESTPCTRLSPKRIGMITQFIEERIGEEIHVADLAKVVSLSPVHFSEIFRNTTGLTPHSYLLKYRVLKANELLLSGENRIVDIAAALGFYDQSHLNRSFKKILGYPPKFLLKKMQASPDIFPRKP